MLSWPESGEFDWRASIATIDASGPFSAFPGVDRTILLIEGDGVHLRSAEDGIDHRLDQLHIPFTFPGEATIYATMLAGTSTNFNLMVRRGRLRVTLQVLTAGTRLKPSHHGVLLSLSGNWRLRVAGGEVHCPVQQGVWWASIRQGAQVEPWIPHDNKDAELLAIRLDPL